MRQRIKVRGIAGEFFFSVLVEEPDEIRVAGVVAVQLEVEAIEEFHGDDEVFGEEGVELNVGV